MNDFSQLAGRAKGQQPVDLTNPNPWFFCLQTQFNPCLSERNLRSQPVHRQLVLKIALEDPPPPPPAVMCHRRITLVAVF